MRIKMAYKAIEIDRTALTIMGISFPDRESFENAASAIGSNMRDIKQDIADDQI
jgi:hypothetical protein